MVFLTYIYVRYKICIKLHFLTYLIIKFCKLRPKIFFAKNVHTGNCVFYWAVFVTFGRVVTLLHVWAMWIQIILDWWYMDDLVRNGALSTATIFISQLFVEKILFNQSLNF